MASKTTKIVVISILSICLIVLGAALAVRWYVKSGRLEEMVKRKVEDSIGATARMDSLSLGWPPRAEIEGLTAYFRGDEESPVLTCQRLTIATTVRGLTKGHIDSIVVVEPRVSLTPDRLERIGSILSGEGTLSFGSVKIINAGIDLDLPSLKATARGILATYVARSTSAGPENIFKLNVDAVDASIESEGREPIPLRLRLINSKFIARPKRAGNEIEGEIHFGLATELPYLELPPNMPVRASFELDHFPKRDSIENAIFTLGIQPSIRVRAYGSITDLTSGAPRADLNVTISAIELQSLVEYLDPPERQRLEGLELSGDLRISGDIKGNLLAPELLIRAKADQGRAEWKGYMLEGLDLELPVAFENETVALKAGRIGVARAIVPMGEKAFEIGPLSALVSGDPERINIEQATARLGDVGEVSMKAAYEPGPGVFDGSFDIADVSVAEALAYAELLIGALPDDLSISGTLDVDLEVGAKAGSGLESLEAKYVVSLAGGEITSGEFFAAAGVDARLEGRVETDSSGELWRFDADGSVGDFEILIDTFYKDFSESSFPFSVSGEYAVKAQSLRGAEVGLDFGPMGKISVAGDVNLASAPEATLILKSDRIDLGAVFSEFGGELLYEIAPEVKADEIVGIAACEVDFRLNEQGWTADGRVKLDDGKFKFAEGEVVMDSVSIDLPFNIYLPQKEGRGDVGFEPEDYGRLSVGGIKAGPIDVPPLDLDVALRQNAISVKGPTSLSMFGGTITLGAVEGRNILGPDAGATASLSVRDVVLEDVTEKLGLPEVVGAVNADYHRLSLRPESLVAEGSAVVSAFGGEIEMSSLIIEKPLSSVRTIKADIEFREIDLLTVTEVLDFGSISGVMEGTLSGLEMSQGQTAAFVADFQTVKRKGVRQRINIDAVQNITILGTGQGFQVSLGRGFASFFEEFGYDTIGFYCTLKNDNFTMKGKVTRGDLEYFVKGVLLGPQINVINRSPGQTVSFKSMIERINRIKSEGESDGE